jgi:hypothetical protein
MVSFRIVGTEQGGVRESSMMPRVGSSLPGMEGSTVSSASSYPMKEKTNP